MLTKTNILKSDIANLSGDYLILKSGERLNVEDVIIDGEETLITIKPLISSVFSEVIYNCNLNELTFYFINNKVITYIDVPKYIALMLALEKSVGRAYNVHIKGKFNVKGI